MGRGQRPGTAVDEELVATLRARLANAVTRPGQWAEGPCYAALAEAELTRFGGPDPQAWLTAGAAFEAIALPWPTAYAWFRAAEAFVAAGDRAAAAAPLIAAIAEAEVMDAVPLAAPLGLTPREHQVLLLLAEGHTNREIGEELFMSEKTASVHVSRILAKLEVGGRVEAAAVAHRLGLTARSG